MILQSIQFPNLDVRYKVPQQTTGGPVIVSPTDYQLTFQSFIYGTSDVTIEAIKVDDYYYYILPTFGKCVVNDKFNGSVVSEFDVTAVKLYNLNEMMETCEHLTYTVIADPSCVAAGEGRCSNCGETFEIPTNPEAHPSGAIHETPATCTTGGGASCSACNTTVAVYSPLGHTDSYNNGGTCTRSGLTSIIAPSEPGTEEEEDT